MSGPANTKIRMIASLMQFLTEELSNESLTADSKDSIEVAIQCLETAYSINPVDGTLPANKSILEIFSSYMENCKEVARDDNEKKKLISDEDKARADALKNEGNELMKNGKFQDALDSYTKAIQIDDTNPIYFCNRAAAHSKLENHQQTLEDCKIAIKHDPNYGKAYCRMGLAYVNLNDHQRARDCYKKAFELDPNESNSNNLKLAEQKLLEQQEQMNQGFNFGNILNNPSLMNMATQLMSDPNMQNMLSSFMTNAMGAQNAETGATPSVEEPAAEGTPGGMDAFLQAGQQIAAQMQAANPELVEQLKASFKKNNDEPDNPDKN